MRPRRRGIPNPRTIPARLLRVDRLPALSRPAFRWELLTSCFLPFAVSCVEPNLIGLVARRVFEAPKFVIATLTAAPHLGFLSTFLTARWLRGRERVRLLTWLQTTLVACVFGIALAPTTAAGLTMLVVLTLIARCTTAGIVTARSDVWRNNYPRRVRARAAGVFAICAGVIAACFGLAMGVAMDAFADGTGPEAANVFRVMYIGAACMGVIGIQFYKRIRWRQRARSMREERAHGGGTDLEAGRLLDVLRNDPTYRKFMFAQFVMGAPNLALSAPFILALDDTLHATNTVAFALTTAIPFLMMIVATPIWARLLERTDIVRFRVVHAWTFFFASGLTAIGLLTVNLPIVFAARVMLGVGFAGGNLAWNLGHHDFAPRHLASLYMGIHVALTGVRGITAPFIGVILYAGWSVTIAGETLAWEGLQGWAFALFAGLSAVGALLFARLHYLIQSGRMTMRGREEE